MIPERPERILLGGALVVVVLSVVAAVAVPGAVAPPDRGPDGPGHIQISDMVPSPGTIAGETAELVVETRLAHRGPTAENVTVEFRAIDLESGLLSDTARVPVDPIEGEREVAVNGSLRVAREGGYRLEAIVYHDDRRLRSASLEVTGVEALRPPDTDSTIEFHRFHATDQPAIEYGIAGTGDGTATLAVTTYLTNDGDAAAGGLRLVLKARQADSGIVADSTEVPIGEIRAGRTATPRAELTVPDGYNYYLDAQLWVDDVIVGTSRSAANLNPSETLSVEETRREVEFEASDFEPGGRSDAPGRTVEATGGQPGFTAGAALLAVLAAALLARRDRG